MVLSAIRSSQRGSDIEGIDQSAQMMDHGGHRVGLDRVAQVDAGGRAARSSATRPCQETSIVGEERRLPNSLGEQFHGHAAHAERAGPRANLATVLCEVTPSAPRAAACGRTCHSATGGSRA